MLSLTLQTPYYENANRVFSYWFSPRVSAEIYARLVSNIVENVSASTRIGNDILFGNIEALGNAFRTSSTTHKRALRGSMLIQAKAIENTARETAAEFSVNRQREVYR